MFVVMYSFIKACLVARRRAWFSVPNLFSVFLDGTVASYPTKIHYFWLFKGATIAKQLLYLRWEFPHPCSAEYTLLSPRYFVLESLVHEVLRFQVCIVSIISMYFILFRVHLTAKYQSNICKMNTHKRRNRQRSGNNPSRRWVYLVVVGKWMRRQIDRPRWKLW